MQDGGQQFAQIRVKRADSPSLWQVHDGKGLNRSRCGGQYLRHGLNARCRKIFPLRICDCFHVNIAHGKTFLGVQLVCALHDSCLARLVLFQRLVEVVDPHKLQDNI